MPRPWLLLPIEIKAREFHAKVLQAAVAAERGFDVVLGEQNAMVRQLPWLPHGLYVDKSVSRTKIKPFTRARSLGNRVAAWCEEGLVYRDRDAYLHERVANESIALVERFFAWGDVQARDVSSKAPEAAAKVAVTGNPRFDVLRPELRAIFDGDVEAIRKAHGRFILLATNFSRYNHFMGDKVWIEFLRQRGTAETDAKVAFYRRWHDYIGSLYDGFVAAVPVLARAFPNHKIVVRPHPSENHDAWRANVAGVRNVEVVFEGNAIPWIAAADALIHNSCTTGVEAYMLGRPVIAYRPATDDVLDSFLPNAVSRKAQTAEELTALLFEAIEGRLVPEADAATHVARYIANSSGPLAVDRIGASIEEIGIPPYAYAPGFGGRARLAVQSAALRLAPISRRVRLGRRADAYARQKFPGLGLSEVQEALARLQQVSGRFAGVRASRLPAHDCFRIGVA